MKRFPARLGILVCALLLALSADDKKKQPHFYVKPAQTADLESIKLVTARQNCENWAIAAGLETMLQQQDVALNQNFWVIRISGGEVCSLDLPSREILMDVVNREFVLEDGRHVELELHYLPGAPANTDALIAGLKLNRPSLLLLHGHVYYLTGATYDEYINRDGSRMFVINELRMANTFPGQPGLAFTKGRDNIDAIGGVITISVTPVTKRW